MTNEWKTKTTLSPADIKVAHQLVDTMLNLGHMGTLTFKYDNQSVTVQRSGAGLETTFEEHDPGN